MSYTLHLVSINSFSLQTWTAFILPLPLPSPSSPYLRHYDAFLALTRPLSMEDPVFTQYKPPYQRLPQNLELINYDGLTCFHLAAMHRWVPWVETDL